MTKAEEDVKFVKIEPHQKYTLNDKEQLRRLNQRGQDLIRNKKGTLETMQWQ
jgi:hypothetical protein